VQIGPLDSEHRLEQAWVAARGAEVLKDGFECGQQVAVGQVVVAESVLLADPSRSRVADAA
jgi:hypothetical protein